MDQGQASTFQIGWQMCLKFTKMEKEMEELCEENGKRKEKINKICDENGKLKMENAKLKEEIIEKQKVDKLTVCSF